MNMCDKYHQQGRYTYTFDPITGQRIPHERFVGICWGTKEQDECSCEGDRCKCDFYENVRKEAKQQGREETLPQRIAELAIKLNSLDLSGYQKDEVLRGEIINELIDIKTIIERRNT